MIETLPFMLDESQVLAVRNISACDGISVLTGRPGSGKTTIIKELLKRLWNSGDYEPENTFQACPTGRASKVLDDALSEDAAFYDQVVNKPATIHRMLGCMGNTWTYNAKNPLPADLVILDESSMVDSELLARVITSVNPGCRIILTGDADQLCPVGPGQPFKDIVDYGKNVSRLTVNHRQRDGSLIANACESIQKGVKLMFGKEGKYTLKGKLEDDLFFEEYGDKENIPERVVELCKGWHKNGEDYQILSPQRNGTVGVENLNNVLQRELNPADREKNEYVVAAWLTIRVGDKVRVTKNNYELKVFNGFIGRVVEIDMLKDITVDFDGQVVTFEKTKDIKTLVLGYCITFHAAQGSQYSKGVIICHSTHSFMLSRNLLYVGVSRFKDQLVIVGDKKGLGRAVRNVISSWRNTYLRDVFKKGKEGDEMDIEKTLLFKGDGS